MMFDQVGDMFAHAAGDEVEVWSLSQNAWVAGVVQAPMPHIVSNAFDSFAKLVTAKKLTYWQDKELMFINTYKYT